MLIWYVIAYAYSSTLFVVIENIISLVPIQHNLVPATLQQRCSARLQRCSNNSMSASCNVSGSTAKNINKENFFPHKGIRTGDL